jgi:hypothetical protein
MVLGIGKYPKKLTNMLQIGEFLHKVVKHIYINIYIHTHTRKFEIKFPEPRKEIKEIKNHHKTKS